MRQYGMPPFFTFSNDGASHLAPFTSSVINADTANDYQQFTFHSSIDLLFLVYCSSDSDITRQKENVNKQKTAATFYCSARRVNLDKRTE